ncbi:MAG TPA: hypothetical protein VLL30_09105, partial [Reyranella sp.]|nr:hypothetical protein [Reyranella sp.]
LACFRGVQFRNSCSAFFLRSLRDVWRLPERRHPPNACCLARSAMREACELRGRSVERLCHGFALELAGDHPVRMVST